VKEASKSRPGGEGFSSSDRAERFVPGREKTGREERRGEIATTPTGEYR